MFRSVLVALIVLAGPPSVGEAAQPGQATALRGRVVDPTGEPVAGLVVAVHRVTAEGGAEIARAESGPDGRFAIPVVADDAVYFAAVRYGDRLHVGVPFRGAPPDDADYLIVVGADETAIVLGEGSGPSGGRNGPAAAWLLVPAAAIGFMVLRWRRGAADPLARRRAAILELAELEERRSRDAVTEEEYRAARAALHDRVGVRLPAAECH